jgi:hypothetical protein
LQEILNNDFHHNVSVVQHILSNVPCTNVGHSDNPSTIPRILSAGRAPNEKPWEIYLGTREQRSTCTRICYRKIVHIKDPECSGVCNSAVVDRAPDPILPERDHPPQIWGDPLHPRFWCREKQRRLKLAKCLGQYLVVNKDMRAALHEVLVFRLPQWVGWLCTHMHMIHLHEEFWACVWQYT